MSSDGLGPSQAGHALGGPDRKDAQGEFTHLGLDRDPLVDNPHFEGSARDLERLLEGDDAPMLSPESLLVKAVSPPKCYSQPDYAAALKESRRRLDGNPEDHFVPGDGQNRPAFHNIDPRGAEHYLSVTCVWNTPFGHLLEGASDTLPNVYLHLRTASALREAAVKALADSNVVVIFPFAREPHTAALNTQYGLSLLPPSNIIPVDAQKDFGARANVNSLLEGTGRQCVTQSEVLDLVDWDIVYEKCGIKPRLNKDGSLMRGSDGRLSRPAGTKGRTMLAGLLTAWVEGRLDDQHYIAFHDTDILNPKQYDALAYLGIPLALHPNKNEIQAVHIAKTGPGRNNEGWIIRMDEMAHSSSNVLVGPPARVLSTLIWPLTGERMARGDILLNMPWTSGMSIETQWDVHLASLIADRGDKILHQVLDPAPKVEWQEAEYTREWSLMWLCREWADRTLAHTKDVGVPLHEWDTEAIKLFNERYGGRAATGLIPSRYHEPNRVVRRIVDVMLPSIAQMLEMGALDRLLVLKERRHSAAALALDDSVSRK